MLPMEKPGRSNADAYKDALTKCGNLTVLQRAQVALIRELDAQCDKCYKQDTMLCGGVRRYYDPEVCDSVGVPRLVSKACPKREEKDRAQKVIQALQRTLIPQAVIDEIIEADSFRLKFQPIVEGTEIYVEDQRLPDVTFDHMIPGIDTRIKEYAVVLAMHGIQAMYIYTADYYRYWMHRGYYDSYKFQTPAMDCDWLIVDGIDFNTPATRTRDALFEILRTRMAHRKPISVIQVGTNPVWATDAETALMVEISTRGGFCLI